MGSPRNRALTHGEGSRARAEMRPIAHPQQSTDPPTHTHTVTPPAQPACAPQRVGWSGTRMLPCGTCATGEEGGKAGGRRRHEGAPPDVVGHAAGATPPVRPAAGTAAHWMRSTPRCGQRARGALVEPLRAEAWPGGERVAAALQRPSSPGRRGACSSWRCAGGERGAGWSWRWLVGTVRVGGEEGRGFAMGACVWAWRWAVCCLHDGVMQSVVWPAWPACSWDRSGTSPATQPRTPTVTSVMQPPSAHPPWTPDGRRGDAAHPATRWPSTRSQGKPDSQTGQMMARPSPGARHRHDAQ